MRKLVTILVIFAVNLMPASAHALDVAPTPATEFADIAPLLVTAYQTVGAATNLAAVELYNTSAKPVKLDDWKVSVVLKDAAAHVVEVKKAHAGWVLPSEHVVLAASTNTTYQLQLANQRLQIATIQLEYTGTIAAYRQSTALIKDTSDAPFFRTYTNTGYSTATQPFTATPARSFYDDGLYQAPDALAGLEIVEVYPYASDCAPNDSSVLCGDYIKLQNITDTDIALDNLALRTDNNASTRTSSNTFHLAGTIKAHSTFAVTNNDNNERISLTNSGGYIWLEDAWGLQRYDNTMVQYAAAGTAQHGYAYVKDTAGAWRWTTTPQPQGINVITTPAVAVQECSEGKYRNPDTGRCRTIEEAVNDISSCDEGYERNPLTNRCRKIAVVATASLTPCGEGQERNPATNRCRSIATAVAELLPCDEGYERNPATNRCRKVTADGMPSAAFPVTPVAAASKDMAGWWAFGVVLALAFGYGAWEWRQEIAGLTRRALGIFARSK